MDLETSWTYLPVDSRNLECSRGQDKSRVISPLICHARNNMSRVYVRSYVVRHDVGRALISGKVARGKFLPRQVCVLSG